MSPPSAEEMIIETTIGRLLIPDTDAETCSIAWNQIGSYAV
jgi:hypothetical protein